MPPRKRTSSVLSDDNDDLAEEVNGVTDPEDALAAAEEAEAEAAEAEAQAAAARARARAIRLRRQAAAATAKSSLAAATAEAPAAEPTVETPVVAAADTVVAPVRPTAADDVGSSATELDKTTAVSTVVDEEPVEDYPTGRSMRWRGIARSRSVWKAVAATLLIVASLALLGISAAIFVQHDKADAQRQQAAEFTAAARQGAVTLMSLNFNTAKADVQRIIDNTTGDFKKNFEEQADDFVKVAQSSKAVTSATVTGVGIQKMTKDTATALVTVTTRVSNMASDKQDPRAWRLSVDLARDGGQIKLSKVEFVP